MQSVNMTHFVSAAFSTHTHTSYHHDGRSDCEGELECDEGGALHKSKIFFLTIFVLIQKMGEKKDDH